MSSVMEKLWQSEKLGVASCDGARHSRYKESGARK